MASTSVARFEYFGVSPFEIEVIYKTLSKFFSVDENILVEDYKYVSLINIEFPVSYDLYFFQFFGLDNWQKIKDLFKEMKRRRGRKRMKILLSFSGITTDINSKLIFSFTSEIESQFEYALEKIEHMVDTVHEQIKNQERKKEDECILYTYDGITMKWIMSDLA